MHHSVQVQCQGWPGESEGSERGEASGEGERCGVGGPGRRRGDGDAEEDHRRSAGDSKQTQRQRYQTAGVT